jgi:hypothetical protein
MTLVVAILMKDQVFGAELRHRSVDGERAA